MKWVNDPSLPQLWLGNFHMFQICPPQKENKSKAFFFVISRMFMTVVLMKMKLDSSDNALSI